MKILRKMLSVFLSVVIMVGVLTVGAVNMSGVKAAAILQKGIDVSLYQGNIDFTKVKAAGYDFVIIRGGYGQVLNQKDPYFEQNYSRAKAAGLNVGVYWYSYASSVEAARLEANVCLQVIKGKKFEYPIYFDLEENSQFAKGASFCNNIVREFCDTLENAGYYAGLYMSCSPLTTYIYPSVAADYALWVAQYYNSCTYSGSYGMWQYSCKGRVNGISGDVDMNYAYVDYPSIIKKVGLNGYTASSGGNPTTPSKSIDQLAEEVFDGKWGDGDDRKKRLTDAGYDYTAVQNRVQELVDEASKAVLTLSKTSLSIEKGKSETITATVVPKNAANKNIKWTTSDSNVATVSEGKITAVGEGTAVITATAYTKTAKCNVTVSPAKTIDQLAEEVFDGKWGDADDRKKRLTDAGYDYTAVQNRVQELVDEASKAVLTLSKTSLSIEKGKSETITATVVPKNAANKNIKWTTNNEKVATVSEGKITAVGVGTAVITATAYTKSVDCTVTVKEPVPALVNNSTVTAQSITLGDTFKVNGAATGGKAPYRYYYYYKKSENSVWSEKLINTTVTSVTMKPVAAGTYDIGVFIKDSDGNTSKKTFKVTVTAALTNKSTVSATTVTVGDTFKVNGAASGGTAPYKYSYYYKKTSAEKWSEKLVNTAETSVTMKPAAAGTYDIGVFIKDSKGNTSKKTFKVTVTAALTNKSTVSATTVTVGSTFKVNGAATGGTAPYKYSYYYKKSSAAEWSEKLINTTATSVTMKPTAAGTYDIGVFIKDSKGQTCKKTLTVTVKSATAELVNKSTVSATTVTVGSTFKVNGAATGGTAPYKYSYYYKKTSAEKWSEKLVNTTSTSVTMEPVAAGTYNIKVTVKDSKGLSADKIFTVTVR